jgi:hypothetical protein
MGDCLQDRQFTLPQAVVCHVAAVANACVVAYRIGCSVAIDRLAQYVAHRLRCSFGARVVTVLSDVVPAYAIDLAGDPLTSGQDVVGVPVVGAATHEAQGPP